MLLDFIIEKERIDILNTDIRRFWSLPYCDISAQREKIIINSASCEGEVILFLDVPQFDVDSFINEIAKGCGSRMDTLLYLLQQTR